MELGWFKEVSLSILQHLVSQVWDSLVPAGAAISDLKQGDISKLVI